MNTDAMTTKTTRWRFVPGFERRYLIRDDGLVWSVRRMQPVKPQAAWSHGYQTVWLWDGRKYAKTVHSLVAAAFLGPRPAGHEVRHLDDNKLHNHVSNLVYGTHSDNMRDAARNGRIGNEPSEHVCHDELFCQACANERRMARYYQSIGLRRRRARQLAAA